MMVSNKDLTPIVLPARYLAHLDQDEKGEIKAVQPLLDHLMETGRLAAESGKPIACFHIGFLLGLCHDVGKGCPLFQDRILGKSRDRVNHSSAGAIFLAMRLQFLSEEIQNRIGRKIAKYYDLLYYPILAHHGLFDCIGEGQNITGEYISRIDDRMVAQDKSGHKLLYPETLALRHSI